MSLVLFSLSLFAGVFVLHWLLWRVWIPRRQILALLVLFLGMFPLVLVLAWLFPAWSFWPEGIWPWLHVGLFYLATSLGYIVTYSALEQDSPSLTVVAFVADAGSEGVSREELYNLISLDFIVGQRLEAMVHGGLIVQAGDVYRLTAKGAGWARLFRFYRQLFRLNLGG